jgi:hypothetical protein
MAFNLLLFMSIMQRQVIGYYFYELNFSFLSGFVNYILTLLVLYLSPSAIINYLFIFRGRRYEKLLKKFPYYNGKLFLAYFLTSMLLPIILMWIGIFLSR